MKIPTKIRDLTKEPYWRENIRKDIENILYKKENITNKDLLMVIEKLYSFFILEFDYFNIDHCEFRKAILELQNPGLPPVE